MISDVGWSASASIPFRALSLPLQVSLLRVVALCGLRADWDSYGSPPIRREAIRSAVIILQAVDPVRLHPARVAPVAGGGIQLSWRRGAKELELEALPDGSLVYLKADSGYIEEGATTLDRVALRELASWLVGRTPAPPAYAQWPPGPYILE